MIVRIFTILALSALLLPARQAVQEATVSQFSTLPDAVRKDLRMRGCTVPQPPGSKKLANLIRGHFRDTQHVDWAVVCDVRKTDTSMLLVYWNSNFSRPALLNKSKLSDGY